MGIEAVGKVETLRWEYKVRRLTLNFEKLYHLKDNWSEDEPRKGLKDRLED